MSLYTDWTPLSKTYDVTRPPAGAEIYLGLAYTYTGKTAPDLHVLDAGCGTGNHIKYLLDHDLGKATVLDADKGMLQQAKQKLKCYEDEDKVKIMQHALPSLPFEDGSFDMVTSNFVLHHLVDAKDEKFNLVQKAIDESYRVLKSKGLMIILLCAPYQNSKGFWYSVLVPEAIRNADKRVPQPETMREMFEKAGFTKTGRIVQPDELVFRPEYYFQADGPLDDGWWKSNSVLNSSDKEEKLKARQTIEDLKEGGALKTFFKEANKERPVVGQYTLYHAVKQ